MCMLSKIFILGLSAIRNLKTTFDNSQKNRRFLNLLTYCF